MRRSLQAAFFTVCGLFVAQQSDAATITINAPDAYGRTFVDLVGEILPDDEKNFEERVANLGSVMQRNVVVTLGSPGGHAIAAMAIGELINKHGWTTYVPSGMPCASSCGLIWLAGTPRTIEVAPGVLIGFHAIYDKDTLKEIGVANALLGAYLTKLGLGYDTVVCVAATEPESMGWLTARFPCGITWEALEPARAVPLSLGLAPGSPSNSQRGLLYEEDASDPQGKRYVGSVIWRTETVSPGPRLAPELAVRADVEIPERHVTMTWSLRRNTDPALPASHTIEILFNLPADFPGGGIANVPGILMKQSEQARGTPLAGLAVKVTNGFFLIGLSSVETDRQRNIQLLQEQPWFDIPIVYADGGRAIVAIEKGPSGDRAFAEAFAAWEKSTIKRSPKMSQSVGSPSADPCSAGAVTVSMSRTTAPLTVVEECGLKSKDSFKECITCPEMVVVPAGNFTMGSPVGKFGFSESPQHTVTFAQNFAVGRFAITADEWDACVDDGGCKGSQRGLVGWPAVNVSWDDAKAYVAWLSQKTEKPYRLLSEAEREYVTRAGTTTLFWWGDSISTTQANYRGTFDILAVGTGLYRGYPMPVDSFEANPWELFQVHGNIWEWTEDCWHESYYGAPADGTAWTSQGDCNRRVIRGGSWDAVAELLRSTARLGLWVERRDRDIGFRVARTMLMPKPLPSP